MAHTYLLNRSQSLTNQISAATEIVSIYIVLVKLHCFTIVGRQWGSSGLSDERQMGSTGCGLMGQLL